MKISSLIIPALVLFGLATASNAATVNSWGKGQAGPSSVRLIEVTGPNGKVGEIHFLNAINIGSGSKHDMTLDFDGYGAIGLRADSTYNGKCPGYCPDTLSVLSLPKQLTASARFLSVAETTLGIISLYINPKAVVPPGGGTPGGVTPGGIIPPGGVTPVTPVTPVPLPATALLLAGAMGGLLAARKRR